MPLIVSKSIELDVEILAGFHILRCSDVKRVFPDDDHDPTPVGGRQDVQDLQDVQEVQVR